ncbi:hypothetical protein BBK36DRAFT_1190462 [Trichoderma citrinoviride]|uniref:Uncharacterized protein n=1 Tax=Trichoderma citrinoviride TaxID=58853 RepID=A0A2T4AXW4_9HYPO|nr:hypothetical protein BBK36DRAFT_1190462 [Trichoderma citrinoviride]PTB61818.1 hypothetical protein BBK36DRAFT_1190462 [Trichoderma citrinoviride]
MDVMGAISSGARRLKRSTAVSFSQDPSGACCGRPAAQLQGPSSPAAMVDAWVSRGTLAASTRHVAHYSTCEYMRSSDGAASGWDFVLSSYQAWPGRLEEALVRVGGES